MLLKKDGVLKRQGVEGVVVQNYHWAVLDDGTVELHPYNDQKISMLFTLDGSLRAGTLRNSKGQSWQIKAEPEP